MVLGKMPPGKVFPGKLPPEINPHENCPPRKIAPGKIAPPCPPPKKYFVKLLHVMEYLNGENFVNFNFRQS